MAKNAKLGLEEHVKKENPPWGPLFKALALPILGKKLNFFILTREP